MGNIVKKLLIVFAALLSVAYLWNVVPKQPSHASGQSYVASSTGDKVTVTWTGNESYHSSDGTYRAAFHLKNNTGDTVALDIRWLVNFCENNSTSPCVQHQNIVYQNDTLGPYSEKDISVSTNTDWYLHQSVLNPACGVFQYDFFFQATGSGWTSMYGAPDINHLYTTWAAAWYNTGMSCVYGSPTPTSAPVPTATPTPLPVCTNHTNQICVGHQSCTQTYDCHDSNVGNPTACSYSATCGASCQELNNCSITPTLTPTSTPTPTPTVTTTPVPTATPTPTSSNTTSCGNTNQNASDGSSNNNNCNTSSSSSSSSSSSTSVSASSSNSSSSVKNSGNSTNSITNSPSFTNNPSISNTNNNTNNNTITVPPVQIVYGSYAGTGNQQSVQVQPAPQTTSLPKTGAEDLVYLLAMAPTGLLIKRFTRVG